MTNIIFQLRLYREENYPQFAQIYNENYMDEWIEHAALNGTMPTVHCDQLIVLADSIKW